MGPPVGGDLPKGARGRTWRSLSTETDAKELLAQNMVKRYKKTRNVADELEDEDRHDDISTNAAAREIVHNQQAHDQFKVDAFLLTERAYQAALHVSVEAELERESLAAASTQEHGAAPFIPVKTSGSDSDGDTPVQRMPVKTEGLVRGSDGGTPGPSMPVKTEGLVRANVEPEMTTHVRRCVMCNTMIAASQDDTRHCLSCWHSF